MYDVDLKEYDADILNIFLILYIFFFIFLSGV